jgi:transposase
MNNTKYGIISLRKQFPNDNACLDFMFDTLHSRKCSCGGEYKRREGRKSYQCSKCRAHISPTAGTIFHKSDTALTTWFHAIMVFSNAKSGMSAMALQRDLEVTYKTAWRMLTRIRAALKQSEEPLSGDVEMDAGYFGGKGHGGTYNKHQKEVMKKKSVVMAAIQRGGEMRAQVVPDVSAKTTKNFLWQNVSTHSRLMTDKASTYENIARGYDRHSVDHHKGEYVRGDVHINSVESFWAHVKRSVKGTHKVISKKHLQKYLDGFVWHYNARTYSDSERFSALLGALLQPVR